MIRKCFLVLTVLLALWTLGGSAAKAAKTNVPLPSKEGAGQQELTDLKIAVGAYQDGLYKIAANYLNTFLRKYPRSPFKTQIALLLAEAYKKTGKQKRALETYQSILNGNKRLNDFLLLKIHYAMFEILKKEHLSKGIVHLEFIEKLAVQKRIRNDIVYKTLLELAGYYRKKKEAKKTEKILNHLLALNPPSPWRDRALLGMAALMVAQKRFEGLRTMLRPIIREKEKIEGPEKAFYLYWALANLKLKRFCVAQKTYKKLIRPYTDTPTLPSVISGYIVSFFQCFADENVRTAAFFSLSKKFQKRPSILFQIYYLEGLVYYQEGHDKKASTIWIKTLKEFPDHPKLPDILVRLDGIFRKTNALKSWEEILLNISKDKKYLPESREIANFFLGNLYFMRRKYATALPFYFGIINNKKYRKFCLERIVLCYYYLKKYKEAKTNLGILLLENPQMADKPFILFLRADLMLRAGKTDKAMTILKRLVSTLPRHKESGDIWVVKAKLELGKIFFLKKDFDNAKKYLLDVLKQAATPIEDNRMAAFYLGLISEKEKNPELSETYFQIASLSKKTPIRVESLFRLALSKKALKSYKESEKIFLSIIRDYGNRFPEWRDLSELQLAEIYMALHLKDKAETQLHTLMEKSKDPDIKAQAGKLLRRLKNKKGNGHHGKDTAT